MQTLIIDNYDSFTFNLYQLIAEVNRTEPIVIRNDQVSWTELQELDFDNIVISPGPGRPEQSKDFGVCRQALLSATVPVLGVCLGHQGLAHCYGATITYAPEMMHGRLSAVYHNDSALFKHIPQPFNVVRYHSLLVAAQLPDCLETIAWTEDGHVMALCHRDLPRWGVQFHPESICTEYGQQLLQNFHDLTRRHGQRSTGRGSFPGISVVPRKRHQPWHDDPPAFEVLYRRLPVMPNAEQTFVTLFGDDPAAFWLDSSRVEPGLSRFSFMGGSGGPESHVVHYRSATGELTIVQGDITRHGGESIFEYLQRELHRRRCASHDLPFDFNGGFVGYFGYELKAECGAAERHQAPTPDAMFLLADRLIAFDHHLEQAYLVCVVPAGATAAAQAWFDAMQERLCHLPDLPSMPPGDVTAPITFSLHRSYESYLADIARCQLHIREGETYEVCLTNRISTSTAIDPLTLYRRLRRLNPAPYAAFLRFGDVAILSSSPERFLHIDPEGRVESKPIKGTLPRGHTQQQDAALRETLRTSSKHRSENLMITDLLRNDLGLVCQVGSVNVPQLMHVESYQTVHQLVSTIRGRLRPDMHALDCIRQAFPGGSMTGAPKLRTLEIIDVLEQEARGVYSGALGFLSLNGSADLNIVIRTIVITPEGASIGVGGAIIALSDAEEEFEEILLKARAPLEAILLTAHGQLAPDTFARLREQLREHGQVTCSGDEHNH
jgi:para-aminobenzoate synthetase